MKKTDLSSRDPDRVRDMTRQFHDWARRAGAVVPYPFAAKKDIRRPPF